MNYIAIRKAQIANELKEMSSIETVIEKEGKNTINSALNLKAWDIRRNAAKRFSCKVMEISWSECLRLAKQGNINYLNRVTKANTASDTFEELLSVHESYNPTLFTDRKEDLAILADAFDYYMQCLGKPNRIFRAKNGYYKDYIFLNTGKLS